MTDWKHKNCGGDIESELQYSDSERDYYFPVCVKCGEGVDLKDIDARSDGEDVQAMTTSESAVRQRLQAIRDMAKFRSKHAPEIIALLDSADLIESLLAEREAQTEYDSAEWSSSLAAKSFVASRAADAALERFAGEKK